VKSPSFEIPFFNLTHGHEVTGAHIRRSDRIREPIPTRFAIASEDYKKVHKAFTMDRSLYGLRIRTDLHLSRGEVVLVLSMGDLRGSFPARAVWVQGSEFGCEGAGLEILGSLPAQKKRSIASRLLSQFVGAT
jgi:hypothetical protein